MVPLVVGASASQAPTEEIAAGKDPMVIRGYLLVWAHRIDENSGSPQRPNSDSSGVVVEKLVPAGVTNVRRRYLRQLLD